MKAFKQFSLSKYALSSPLFFSFSQESNQPPTSNPNTITPQNAQSLIQKWVKNNKVCLFMKGSPDMPRCGFSRLMVEILKVNGLSKYKYIDVLENPIVRDQVRVYSKWPTYPQLFIDGQLIGGSDVVNQMHQDHSLKKLLQEKKIVQ